MPGFRYAPEDMSNNRNYVHLENDYVPWTAVQKPLNQTKFGLITMGGFHLPDQPAFTDEEDRGDHTFRELPRTIRTGDCQIAHTHYDHRWVLEDMNCLLPLDIFSTLEEEGVIGELSHRHFAFMGSIPNPLRLIADTAPEVARRFLQDDVEAVVLAST